MGSLRPLVCGGGTTGGTTGGQGPGSKEERQLTTMTRSGK